MTRISVKDPAFEEAVFFDFFDDFIDRSEDRELYLLSWSKGVLSKLSAPVSIIEVIILKFSLKFKPR